MIWAVRIIPPGDKVSEIKWKKWFFSLLFIFAVLTVIWFSVKGIESVNDNLRNLFFLLSFLLLSVYFLILSIRVYYYGVCLSLFEVREKDNEETRRKWTEWASEKLNVFAYNLFLPSEISPLKIASSQSIEILKEQRLKLSGYNGEAFTEEQLIYELLSSVRSSLMELQKLCVFDIVFTYGNSPVSFSIFKESWIALGFSEKCLDSCYYWNDTVEEKFDTLSHIEINRVAIILSANVEDVEGYCSDLTEFTSILLVTHKEQLTHNKIYSAPLRTMACKKDLTKQELTKMMTYQPDVLQSTKILFSNMSINETSKLSEIISASCLPFNVEWEYETQHLDLNLGRLGDASFWLVFTLSLFISEKNNKPILLVASVNGDYVFNVFKKFDCREH
ncbi:hypothetical protein NOX22_01605 [Enterobacter cloacae]|uniref:hypothetical protein n=1 Tax=Enterobacter cloacae TaxID=550 RepID=UPI00210E149E|nr:hypothetical protein [Enterobacter cloacae]MCQ4443304.1 hypothetical protein [Enterobacter cloacae]